VSTFEPNQKLALNADALASAALKDEIPRDELHNAIPLDHKIRDTASVHVAHDNVLVPA